jgi:hypothetical protein
MHSLPVAGRSTPDFSALGFDCLEKVSMQCRTTVRLTEKMASRETELLMNKLSMIHVSNRFKGFNAYGHPGNVTRE